MSYCDYWENTSDLNVKYHNVGRLSTLWHFLFDNVGPFSIIDFISDPGIWPHLKVPSFSSPLLFGDPFGRLRLPDGGDFFVSSFFLYPTEYLVSTYP